MVGSLADGHNRYGAMANDIGAGQPRPATTFQCRAVHALLGGRRLDDRALRRERTPFDPLSSFPAGLAG
jgi:hypothetical protein